MQKNGNKQGVLFVYVINVYVYVCVHGMEVVFRCMLLQGKTNGGEKALQCNNCKSR